MAVVRYLLQAAVKLHKLAAEKRSRSPIAVSL